MDATWCFTASRVCSRQPCHLTPNATAMLQLSVVPLPSPPYLLVQRSAAALQLFLPLLQLPLALCSAAVSTGRQRAVVNQQAQGHASTLATAHAAHCVCVVPPF